MAYEQLKKSHSLSSSSSLELNNDERVGFFSMWSSPILVQPEISIQNFSIQKSSNSSEKAQKPSRLNLLALESDCLPIVFGCLDYQDLTRASAVCKAMNETLRSALTDSEIWASLWREALDIIGVNSLGEPDLLGTMPVQLVLAPTYRDKFKLWFKEYRLCVSSDWRCRGPQDPRFEGFNFCRYCEIPWMKAEEAQNTYGIPLTAEILRRTPMQNPSGWTPRELRRALIQCYGSWSGYLETKKKMETELAQKQKEERRVLRERKKFEKPRREKLKQELAKFGLSFQEEHKTCRGYIEGKLEYSLDRVVSTVALTSWLLSFDYRVGSLLGQRLEQRLAQVKTEHPESTWMDSFCMMQKETLSYVEAVYQSFLRYDEERSQWLEYQNPYFYPFTSQRDLDDAPVGPRQSAEN